MIDIYNYLDINIIKAKAKYYSKELWGIEYNLPIIINGRYKQTLGSMWQHNVEKPAKMELSKQLLTGRYKELTIDDVLLHELCHWYCGIKGKQTSDSSSDFIREARRIGTALTNVIGIVGLWHYGKCEKCGSQVIEKESRKRLDRYLNTDRYHSICCHSQIVYGGIQEYKDNHIVNHKIVGLNNSFRRNYIRISA